jgi:hypothetical protein
VVAAAAAAAITVTAALSAAHRRRLREVWRSAGWPCKDLIELDLLAQGYLLRHWDEQGRETLRVSDSGLQLLAQARQRHQAARNAHEDLVARVAADMQRAGRLVWRGLTLRAPLVDEQGATQWVMAMPDVFSIRQTTVESYVEPVVHEIKVSRADLLSDLRKPAKGQAYRALASQCWYVVRAGLAGLDDVPADFGLMEAGDGGLTVLRPAPRRPMTLPLAAWMALARAHAEPAQEFDAQAWLGEPPPAFGDAEKSLETEEAEKAERAGEAEEKDEPSAPGASPPVVDRP